VPRTNNNNISPARNAKLYSRSLQREATLQGELLEVEGIPTEALRKRVDRRNAKWLARGSSSAVVKTDNLKALSTDPLEGDSIISLPSSKSKFSNFSFNHLLGFLLGKRISLLAPDSNEIKQRAHFIEGLVGGLSNTFLTDLSNPDISSLKISPTQEHTALKKYFAPLRKASDTKRAHWFSNSLVSSALDKLKSLNPSKLAKIIKNTNVEKPIIQCLSNFWESWTKTRNDAIEPQSPLLAAI